MSFVILVLSIISFIFVLFIILKLHKRNAHVWGFKYLYHILNRSHVRFKFDKTEHILFLLVDHHEHPFDNLSAKNSADSWVDTYRKIVEGIADDYGRSFQYTWFYPFDDYRTPEALLSINRLVYEGYGELEFHWHNNHIANDDFLPNLKLGVDWFQQIGAMKEYAENGKAAFGYIAGNWELDNGLGLKEGPSRELDHLSSVGCYADFTFPNTSVSQPGIYSSIYYAKDDGRSRSYDKGAHSMCGRKGDGFMIFQGPSALDFKALGLELGAVEAWYGANWQHRIPVWFKNAPYVKGSPEWRFVKVFTHGGDVTQSRSLILSHDFREMLSELKKYAVEKNIKLHFVTAREAYNLVRAAEDQCAGDPNEYLDYEIKPPINRFININKMVSSLSACNKHLKITSLAHESFNLSCSKGPIVSIEGSFKNFAASVIESKLKIDTDQDSNFKVITRIPIDSSSIKFEEIKPWKEVTEISYSYKLGD